MKRLKVALDSGAFSLYNSKFAVSKKGMESDKDLADYDYYTTSEFQQYVEDYIEYVTQHLDEIDMHVAVDIIYNAKASWEVQQYMETCGLLPVPVFHYGEDWKYLERYLDNYEYVGVGGLGQRTSVQSYITFGDEIFKRVCDENGRPRNKMHGFAMTSVQLMKRYPWYSCDSSTWGSLSRNGWARFPRLKRNGDYDWLRKPIAWRFTERSRHAPVHIDKQPKHAKRMMEEYLQEYFGLQIADLKDYFARDVVNAGHAFLLGEALKKYYRRKFDFEQGANIYIAGNTGDAMSTRLIKREFTRASRPLSKNTSIGYLASFFYPKVADMVFAAMKPSKRRKLK